MANPLSRFRPGAGSYRTPEEQQIAELLAQGVPLDEAIRSVTAPSYTSGGTDFGYGAARAAAGSGMSQDPMSKASLAFPPGGASQLEGIGRLLNRAGGALGKGMGGRMDASSIPAGISAGGPPGADLRAAGGALGGLLGWPNKDQVNQGYRNRGSESAIERQSTRRPGQQPTQPYTLTETLQRAQKSLAAPGSPAADMEVAERDVYAQPPQTPDFEGLVQGRIDQGIDPLETAIAEVEADIAGQEEMNATTDEIGAVIGKEVAGEAVRNPMTSDTPMDPGDAMYVDSDAESPLNRFLVNQEKNKNKGTVANDIADTPEVAGKSWLRKILPYLAAGAGGAVALKLGGEGFRRGFAGGLQDLGPNIARRRRQKELDALEREKMGLEQMRISAKAAGEAPVDFSAIAETLKTEKNDKLRYQAFIDSVKQDDRPLFHSLYPGLVGTGKGLTPEEARGKLLDLQKQYEEGKLQIGTAESIKSWKTAKSLLDSNANGMEQYLAFMTMIKSVDNSVVRSDEVRAFLSVLPWGNTIKTWIYGGKVFRGEFMEPEVVDAMKVTLDMMMDAQVGLYKDARSAAMGGAENLINEYGDFGVRFLDLSKYVNASNPVVDQVREELRKRRGGANATAAPAGTRGKR